MVQIGESPSECQFYQSQGMKKTAIRRIRTNGCSGWNYPWLAYLWHISRKMAWSRGRTAMWPYITLGTIRKKVGLKFSRVHLVVIQKHLFLQEDILWRKYRKTMKSRFCRSYLTKHGRPIPIFLSSSCKVKDRSSLNPMLPGSSTGFRLGGLITLKNKG